jgi:membrane protein DedA with SNARE-associated domain
MKVFNIVALSLALAILGSQGVAMLFESLLGQSGQLPAMLAAVAIGISARRLVEYILGYSLSSALRGEDDTQQR